MLRGAGTASSWLQSMPRLPKPGGRCSEIKLASRTPQRSLILPKSTTSRGYPLSSVFKNQKPMDYGGGRTAPEIVNWLLKKTGPPAIELTDVEAAKKFSEKDEVVLIAFFEDLESKGALAFKAVAEIQDSLAFGITSSQEVAEALGAPWTLMTGKVVYDGEYIAEDIESFIIMEQLPLVTIFSDDTAPKIFGGSIRSHLLAFFAQDDENAEATLEELRMAAKQFKGKILLCQIDDSGKSLMRINVFASSSTSKTESRPRSRLINLEERHECSVVWSLQAAVSNLGRTGRTLASDDDVVVAKMDATKNEVDGVQVTGFPTLKVFMKETNESETDDVVGEGIVSDDAKYARNAQVGGMKMDLFG
ncbi:Protein disulfide-isomerase [Geodia barretti]|uniref:Protein disulfide-isomerase n=1 Tax=Geodia barretti TaxID=519541 RepID=A0AA35W324_GEOBA|nr:Protein disulfide-isomerase [Geodia barretti]